MTRPGMPDTLAIGDQAVTRYNGKPQTVTITHIKHERVCQSGVMYRVDPPLRTWRDRSNPFDDWPACWYDAAWFTKA